VNASEVHLDVASYALGILDAVDVERFEEHLVTCDACALELERFLPVTQALAGVDRHAFAQAERTVRDGMMFDRMRNVVSIERKRRRTRTSFLVAAAAAVAVLATLALSIGLLRPTGDDAGTNPGTNAGATAGPGRATVGAPSNTAPADQTPGLSAPPAGAQFSATDPLSGAKIDLVLDSRPWGSQLSVTLRQVHGPLTCTLLVVGKNGKSEPAGTWNVSSDGYGTTAHPEPLVFAAPTSMQGSAIDRIEVRATGNGTTSTLVSVKV
jgi:hypothetical protein